MLEETLRQDLRRSAKESAEKGDARASLAVCRQLLHGSPKAADVFFCSTMFARLADSMALLPGIRRLRTYVVRSVTVEPILPYIHTEAVLAGFALTLNVGGFGSYVDEMLNPQSALYSFSPELVLVVLDVDDVAGRLPDLCADGVGAAVQEEVSECAERMWQLLKTFRSHSKARLVVQGFVVPDTSSLGEVGDANFLQSLPNAVRSLNLKLAQICGTISDCAFFDVDHLASRYGRRTWRDTRLFLASRLPVAAAYFSPYARGLVRSVAALHNAPRKVLCTDLDNTLWGGVLGEEGPDGITTGNTFPGTPFYQYQRYLKQLSSRGILLAAVSKNNEADVREVFKRRASDLALSLDDFAALKIGWAEKTTSLLELATELSLSLDSFVFVDDNPVEAEAVRQHLPAVAVIEAPLDEPWTLLDLLAEQPYFDALNVTEDDRNRLNEYKAQAQRTELESSVGSRDEFLASLGIVCTFDSALNAPLARAVQLLAKTNQFNLTTRRRSAAEIEEFAATEGGQAVVVRVRDRFGDAGVVGLALARQEGDTCVIDSFLLSCRVIGRGIETALLAYLAAYAARQGATRLVGEFIPTKKNAPCASFYPDHGFTQFLAEADEHVPSVFYELDLSTSGLMMPPWITPEGIELDDLAARALVTS